MGMPVTIKGQVTIPKPIRDRLGITPGASSVEFELREDGQVLLHLAEPPASAPDRFVRFRQTPPAGWNGMTAEQVMRLTRGEDWGDAG
jgi:AbrB family looped-hinge helix DNA binding protein